MQIVEIDFPARAGIRTKTIIPAENQVGSTAICRRIVRQGRADQKVGKAVSVDVARSGNAGARLAADGFADDDKALIAKARGINRAASARTAEYDIRLAGAVARRVHQGRADDDVVIAVAVDVAEGRNAFPRPIAHINARNGHVSGAEIDGRAEAGLPAEHDIGCAGAAGAGDARADDNIFNTVAIDVAGGGNARASLIASRNAAD